MTREFTTDTQRVLDFVCPLADIDPSRLIDPRGIGVVRHGRLVGGAVFENYTGEGGAVELHVAGEGPMWCSREFRYVVFHYAFKQLGCKVVYGRVPSWRPNALKFDLKLGFTLEYVLRDATPKGDMYLVAMRKENCEILSGARYGRQN